MHPKASRQALVAAAVLALCALVTLGAIAHTRRSAMLQMVPGERMHLAPRQQLFGRLISWINHPARPWNSNHHPQPAAPYVPPPPEPFTGEFESRGFEGGSQQEAGDDGEETNPRAVYYDVFSNDPNLAEASGDNRYHTTEPVDSSERAAWLEAVNGQIY
eukprot:CAMPEP_0173434608 /NCGR_PEP_ID=MMETSP1357-20121228/13143_1 /TAXON_ID=77926 /ORGANISM="Hemiselmis rufescens, Strain PCC563" /LENGTH=159 /DNA_ID=CAMNT_0014399489 /DNA_START=27 /DNA_END=506 /DNA_ORIENTATION=-